MRRERAFTLIELLVVYPSFELAAMPAGFVRSEAPQVYGSAQTAGFPRPGSKSYCWHVRGDGSGAALIRFPTDEPAHASYRPQVLPGRTYTASFWTCFPAAIPIVPAKAPEASIVWLAGDERVAETKASVRRPCLGSGPCPFLARRASTAPRGPQAGRASAQPGQPALHRAAGELGAAPKREVGCPAAP